MTDKNGSVWEIIPKFRVARGDEKNPQALFVVQVWAELYGGYQVLKGGFESQEEAQAFIDGGHVYKYIEECDCGQPND